MKAPHQKGPGGWGPHHHKQPPPKHPPPKPPHHKQPRKPKPPPKPKKTHAHKKPRKLSPGSDVACCTAEAVGWLLGWGWDEVLALYWRTASDPDSGASIADTLNAARVPGFPVCDPWPADHRSDGEGFGEFAHAATACVIPSPGGPWSLILGVELPRPHAIAVTPDGTWWSWGQPFNPHDWPQLVVEETWAVQTWRR